VDGFTIRGEVQKYDAKLRQFVPYLPGVAAEGLDFSQDGQRVAYVTVPDGKLWQSNIHGGEKVQLTVPPMRAGMPRWSPDGKRVAFMGALPARPWKIYVVSDDGANVQQLTSGTANDGDPNWSPDGNLLVFGGEPDVDAQGGGPKSPTAIRVLNLATNQVSTVPGSDGLYSPRWSPNGRYLAAQSADSTKLLLYDFETQKWRDLVKVNAEYFSWSHDGKYIYLTAGGTDPIFARVGVLGEQRMERLASFASPNAVNAVQLLSGSFGQWTGIARDDSLLILRDTSSDEIYALDVQLP